MPREPDDLPFRRQVISTAKIAEKESRFIDDHHPEYAFSSKAAIRRGTLGLFQTAAQKARAILTTKNGNARGHCS
jgi:hypothetical protein